VKLCRSLLQQETQSATKCILVCRPFAADLETNPLRKYCFQCLETLATELESIAQLSNASFKAFSIGKLPCDFFSIRASFVLENRKHNQIDSNARTQPVRGHLSRFVRNLLTDLILLNSSP